MLAWNDKSRSTLGRLAQTGVLAIAFVVAFLYAKHALATTYEPYDDEGYMLLTVKSYLAGGQLYSEVATQYGPVFSMAEGAFFRLLGAPVTHDAGRLLTLILWMTSAAFGAAFVYRISRSGVLASAATLAMTALGVFLAHEPGHPQQFILPIFMLACCLSAWTGFPKLRMALLGALGSALLFIKINIGIFYFAALFCLLLCCFPPGRARKIGTALLLAYAAAAPVILMRAHLSTWAGGFCLTAILCGVTTFLSATLATPGSFRPAQNAFYAAAGALLTGALIVSTTLLHGMSFQTLLDGVLWEPLKHPGVFVVPLPVRGIKLAVVLPAWVCMGLLYWFRERWTSYPWIDVVRVVAGLGAVGLLATVSPSGRLVVILPLLPLVLLRKHGVLPPWAEFAPRVFVISLAAAQFLESYPVAGSQLGISASPALLWGFVCIHDGAIGLSGVSRRIANQTVLGLAITIAFGVWMAGSGACSLHYRYPASRLRGASSLHLDPNVENRYQYLARNVRANCDFLFSFPMLGSLNLWSGVPTANGLNHSDWIRTLDPARQVIIVEKFRATPRACAIFNQAMTEFWENTPEDLNRSPLARYILSDMRKVTEFDGYEIRVSPGRESPWVEAMANPVSSH